MAKQGFKIVNGPSKFDLMNGLFLKDHIVQFTIVRSNRTQSFQIILDIKVNLIEAEDGSRESWIIEGYWDTHDNVYNRDWKMFHAYYNGRDRTGIFEER